MKEENEKKSVTVKINEDLWKQLKLEAVQRGLKLQEVVTEAIIRLLDQINGIQIKGE